MIKSTTSQMILHLIVSILPLSTFAFPWVTPQPKHQVRQSSSPPSIPDTWEALGCYTDNTASRTLRTASTTSLTDMTLSSCIDFCTMQSLPFTYAGVEFGRECYCDTAINSPGALADASGCNVPCTGDNSQSCGGADRVFIAHKIGTVATTTTPTTTPTSTPTQPSIKQSVGTWEYQGCFTDLGITRILLHETTVSSNSAEICTSACGANGYPLAGLEFAKECFCDTYMPFGEKRPDSECFMTCTGDPTELCGAGNRLALYANSVATPPSPSSCLGLQAPGSPFEARPIEGSFVATDLNSESTGLRIYVETPEPHDPAVTPLFHILSHCQTNCASLGTHEVLLWSEGMDLPFRATEFSAAPTVGESPVFVTIGAGVPRYMQFCAHPEPHSPTGPFVGFPVLAVDGRSDLWAICANQTQNGRLDVVYSPVSGHPHYDISDCTQMYLQLVPEYALPPS